MLTSTAQPAVARPVVVAESIRNVTAFHGLQEEWRELLHSSGANSLFLSWEWLYTWWKNLAEDRELSILTLRCDGDLVGVAPFCRRPASLRNARAFPVVEFLGNGAVGSDYLDVIVRRGWEPHVRAAIALHLRQTRPVVCWTNVARDTSSAAAVATTLGGEGWNVREATTNLCPYIPLEGKTWEEYLASLGAEHRYNFNRKWRRLNRDYFVSFGQASTEAECRESIDLTMALHRMRWNQRGDSEAFDTPELVAFHQNFAQVAFQHAWLRLYVLRLDGKPAACLYGFLYARKFYFYQSGFDPALEKYSVGMLSMGLGIQKAIEEGATEFDMLHGAEPYKFHWASESRELSRWELYPPGARGLLSRSAVEWERAARALARRALSRIL